LDFKEALKSALHMFGLEVSSWEVKARSQKEEWRGLLKAGMAKALEVWYSNRNPSNADADVIRGGVISEVVVPLSELPANDTVHEELFSVSGEEDERVDNSEETQNQKESDREVVSSVEEVATHVPSVDLARERIVTGRSQVCSVAKQLRVVDQKMEECGSVKNIHHLEEQSMSQQLRYIADYIDAYNPSGGELMGPERDMEIPLSQQEWARNLVIQEALYEVGPEVVEGMSLSQQLRVVATFIDEKSESVANADTHIKPSVSEGGEEKVVGVKRKQKGGRKNRRIAFKGSGIVSPDLPTAAEVAVYDNQQQLKTSSSLSPTALTLPTDSSSSASAKYEQIDLIHKVSAHNVSSASSATATASEVSEHVSPAVTGFKYSKRAWRHYNHHKHHRRDRR
jgi:hypothetical protein